MSYDYSYYKEIFQHIPMPYAFCDMNQLQQNMQHILDLNHGKKIRIASKSIRCLSILKKIFNASDQFQGIMCYSPEEAVFLCEQGFDDILIAYPITNPIHITYIIKQLQQQKQIILMVDCLAHIQYIEQVAKEHDCIVPLCIDIDMSSVFFHGLLHFGVHRSPLRHTDEIIELAEHIQSSPYTTLQGIMGYEAQIAGLPDDTARQKWKNTLITLLKKKSYQQVKHRRQEIVQSLHERGIHLPIVNGGGTGSIHWTSTEDVITEITVGSAFFAPSLFDPYRALNLRPAALYAIEIVRKPSEHMYTCLGGGYVASGQSGKDKLPLPYLPAGGQLLTMEGAGEVQTPISFRSSPEVRLEIGDPIFMRHSKAGELCERFNELYIVENGAIQGTHTTYRGDGKCFI
ncbi:amino acid deaminase/aldolase [Longirhabdus pacifica]|uniref:amino acid deaminase/aldolase n=1 Tax=Longirhabdus pacifica TaxID=2305227 RepID=UPI0027B98CFF|nr:amino acid deaminase/aldolase [Longirhabdus pacifica]